MSRLRAWARNKTFKLFDAILAPYLFYSHTVNALRPIREFYFRAFKALAVNGISGDYAEFGVFMAGKWRLAHRFSRMAGQKRKFWGFDSFAGLPENDTDFPEHPNWAPGRMQNSEAEFHRICEANGIPRSDYELIPGFFSDTLENQPDDREPRNIALAFIDCDMYTSTVSVLKFLGPRLKHGMIIAFDDYWVWSEQEISGERKAFLEFQRHCPEWHFEPFCPVGWHGASFVVERKSALP